MKKSFLVIYLYIKTLYLKKVISTPVKVRAQNQPQKKKKKQRLEKEEEGWQKSAVIHRREQGLIAALTPGYVLINYDNTSEV